MAARGKLNRWKIKRHAMIFSIGESHKGVFDFPKRARTAIPEEYKNLSNNREGYWPAVPTVRACMPFFDAMTLGFIVATPFDFHLRVANNGYSVEVVLPPVDGLEYGLDSKELISAVPQDVVGKMFSKPVFKLETPYWVETAFGFSAFLTSLVNAPSNFSVVSGMPDTDRMTTKIKVFFCWLGEDGEHFIPAGTPIAQVFPVKRTSQQSGQRLLSAKEVTEKMSGALRSRIQSKWYRHLIRAKRND